MALATLLLAGAGTVAAPASADVLISNIAKTAANNNGLNSTFNRAATAFTTGSNDSSYTLESVDLVLGDLDANDTFTVTIRTVSSNLPGSVHATLTNPTLANGTNTFTAPSGTTLSGSTTYFVHIERTAGSFQWGTTSDDGEDTGGATGWSIANTGYSKAGNSAWNHLNTRSHRFRVNGDSAPTVTTATVSGTSLTIVFNEELAAASALANSAFAVKKTASGSEQTVMLTGSPAISGNEVTLTLDSAVVSTDTGVKVSYTKPSTGSNNKLKDSNDNEVESFTDQSVRNKATESPDLTQVSVTSTPRSGTSPNLKYGEGEKIQVTLIFDEAVTVTGDPEFEIKLGNAGQAVAKRAAYVRGSGSRVLVFEYTVLANDEDDNGIWIEADAVKLDADDLIQDSGSNNADLTHTALKGQSNHKVDGNLTPPTDTTAPTVSSAEVTAAKPKELVLTFSEALATGSVPAASAFAVKIDSSAGPAVSSIAIDGDDATKLKLGLAVALDAGDSNVTVDYTNPGTANDPLKDGADNEVATFTGQSVTNNAPACPSGQPADAFWTACLTVAELTISGSTVGYGFGGSFGSLTTATFTQSATSYTVDFLSYTTTKANSPLRLSFTTDPRPASESWVFQVGSHSYRFDAKDDYDTSRHTYDWDNPATTWGDANIGDKVSLSLRPEPAPVVTQVAVTSTPKSGTTPKKYGVGEKIQVTVTFDEAVTVTGDPLVQVVVGNNTREADYASGSGTTALVFEYTVVAADTDTDGIEVNADVKLDSDSGSEDYIRDGDGQDADVSFTALAAQSAHQVDGSLTPPAACPSGQPADAFWKACLTAGNLAGTGTGYLKGVIGTLNPATVSHGGNSYNVDGFSILSSGLALSFESDIGTTVTAGWRLSVGSTEFPLASASYGSSSGTFTWSSHSLSWSSGDQVSVSLRVMATNTAPTASDGEVKAPENYDYIFAAADFNFMDTDAGDTLEAVKIVTLPATGKGVLFVDTTLLDSTNVPKTVTKAELDNGDLFYRPPTNESGDDFATFNFKVNDGDNDSASANTMTIDVLQVPDITRVSVTSTPRSGTTPKKYGAGEKIQVTVTFDETVTVTGDPVLEFLSGTTGTDVKEAALESGSGTNALVFEYTVQSGDRDPNGIFIEKDAVKLDADSGAEDYIRDSDGNNAILIHTQPGLQSDHQVDGSLTPPSPPVSTSTLVKNIGQTAEPNAGLGSSQPRLATAFTTGGNAGGYSLTSVDLVLSNINTGDNLTVTIRDNSSRDPGSVHATLTNPTLGNGTKTFTAPSNTVLDANTTYWVHAEQVSGALGLGITASNSEDSGAARGWSIADVGRAYVEGAGNTFDWLNMSSGRSLRFSVNGTANSTTIAANEYVITGVPYWKHGGQPCVTVPGEPLPELIPEASNPNHYRCRIIADEGGSPETFRVRMKNPVTQAVTVSLSPRDGGALSVAPTELTFTSGNWQTDQQVSVSGLTDADGLDEWSYIYLTGETGAKGDSVRVQIEDDDPHTQSGDSLIYDKSDNRLRVQQDGDAQEFTVRLRFQPEGNVTLNWDPLISGPVRADGDGIKVFKDTFDGQTPIPAVGGVKISPKYMTFTRDNWNTAQTFTVTADDGIAGTTIHLRPWWEKSQYPYTSTPEFAIEVVTNLLPSTAPPDAPVMNAAAGDGAVRLTWTIPDDGEGITGWQARYSAIDPQNSAVDWGEWYTIPGAEPDTVAHTVTGLTNGTIYAFQVRAVAGRLKSAASNTNIVTPMAGMTLDAPGRPDLSVKSGNAAAMLSWNEIIYSGTITGWQYRYGVLDTASDTVDWGDWTDIEDATAQTLSHTVTGLVNDTQYGIQLRAVSGENAGDMSRRRVAWPYHPTFEAVEFTAVTSSTVTMGWALPQGVEATSLRAMHRLLETEGEWEEAQLALDATSHTFTGLTPDTRYQFRIVFDSATGSTATGSLPQTTLAFDPLDTQMEGSPSDRPKNSDDQLRSPRRSPQSPAERRCEVTVSIEFLDADGNAVAVESLAASDFTVTNGRAGTPVADADGLGWTVPVRATTDERSLIRVRLAQNARWTAAEQVFYNRGAGVCAPAARGDLADLQIDDIGINPGFSAATTSYTARTTDADAEVHAEALYTDAAVTIAPADADEEADGHQLALAEGETAVTITVTPGDGSAVKTYSVTVTREAQTTALTGFVLVDASTDADLGAIADGDTVTVTEGVSYGIRAGVDAQKQVGSVVLTLAGPGETDTHTQTENIKPYSLFGDAGGAEHGRTFTAGSYTLTATAYELSRGEGAEISSLAVAFTVAVEAAPAGVLSGFTLLDASDQSTVATLSDGAQVDLGDNADGSFAIRAEVASDATVGSVALSLTGTKTVSATENIAPYSLWGDDMNGTLHGGTLPAGSYTLTAKAHAGSRASGAVLGTLSWSFEVLEQAALSVADAQVREGPNATLDFAVTLDRSSTGTVTVAYATADGTATAGSDYTAASGTLTFSPGDREKIVSVAVLEDDVDDDGETMTLRLSSPSGARIEDGEATGTINNTDAIPAAWLVRFGRTVTGQVLQAVEDRLTAPRQEDSQLTLAGQALPSWRSEKTDRPLRDAASERAEPATFEAGGPAGAMGFEIRGLTPREFWTGTSFNLTSKTGEGHAALWGRASVARFDGREGALAVDGEVTTGLVGADWATQERIAGLAIGLSSGSGGWRRKGECQDNCGGTIEADLTGLYPYMGIDLSERVSLWAAAGYGTGEVTVRPDEQASLSADLTMTMGAAGLRGDVLRPEDGQGFSVAVKGDARFTRTSSDPVSGSGGNLSASDADTWLVRMGIEGSRSFDLGSQNNGASLTPSFEIALRLDGGDAETGIGADLGGGLAYSDPDSGVAMDMRARVLIAHESPGFREWGASFAASWDPRPESERGFALSLRHSWGAAPAGGMDALLTRETMAGLAGHDGGRFQASRRLEIEIGHGLPAFNGRFTGTPNASFGMSPGARDWRIGWRLTPAGGGSEFEASLDATRRESDHDRPEHGVTLTTAIRW